MRNRKLGFFLAAIGLILLIGAIFSWNIGIWDFWPLILVLLGISMMFGGSFIGGGIATAMGVAFLVENVADINILTNKYFVPIVVLLIGLILVLSPNSKGSKFSPEESVKLKGRVNRSFLFTSKEIEVDISELDKGRITSTFSSIKVIITGNSAGEGKVLNLGVLFGEIEVFVDEGIALVVNGKSNFADENIRVEDSPESASPLYIDYSVLFGEISIQRRFT